MQDSNADSPRVGTSVQFEITLQLPPARHVAVGTGLPVYPSLHLPKHFCPMAVAAHDEKVPLRGAGVGLLVQPTTAKGANNTKDSTGFNGIQQ